MSHAKWTGAVGIAKAVSAKGDVASAVMYPVCESANHEGAPVTVDRINNITPDILGIGSYGHEFTWTIDGIEPTVNMAGYLYWLAMGVGSDSFMTSTHTITPKDLQDYLVVFIDRGSTLGAGPTVRLNGCKIGSLSLEFTRAAYAKISVSGIGVELASANIASLSPTVLTGETEAPLSWAGLQAAGGFVKIGYEGNSSAEDPSVTGLKIDFTRDLVAANHKLDDDQATEIHEGMRTVTFEISREFTGAEFSDDYNAWKSAQQVELDIRSDSGADHFRIQIPAAKVVGSYAGEVGVGAESIVGTLQCRAYIEGSDNLFNVFVEDTVGGASYA